MNGRDRTIGRDPMAAIPIHRPDDHFVPLRSKDLAEYLSRDAAAFGDVAAALPALCDAITDVIQQEAVAFDRELVHRYVPFNPDAETIIDPADTQRRTEASCCEFISRIEYLLEKTNFVQLSGAQIEEACRAPRSEKLRVRLHPDRVRHISVWVRGRGDVPRKRRNWRGAEETDGQRVPVHRRLALVFRFPNDPYVYLKVFKEIPTDEVDALLPHAEVRMTIWDRLMVAGGGVGVVGSTFSKIMAAIKAVAYWSNLAWVVLVGSAVIAWRAFRGFRNAKTRRNWMLTRRLYYQNLDNNVGVIHKLLAMVAQEEVKEALLAYAFCASGRLKMRSAEELRGDVENYLRAHFKVEVDFDVLDAIETLRRLRLWGDANGLRPLEPRAALAELQAHWIEKRTIGHHDEAAARRGGGSAPRDAQQR
ncbi:MAG: DUF3754 domain-containing protein [Phycisphaerales bacterium]|nr:DUF3754 domain-containing protein [Phycisphaerales bacterium]